ncbi:hypothetical protein B0J11DRAFT_512482 [Dendryphion nanum]|uniref:Uncharacterized protein n=1 Tax=Dendryphion nanum TaxID=256645 RepID=A0A9P9I7D2_9PLEO|nr:hypothetical protein B0J11DRAFT_512482 [Dendryphion nanum]
MAQSSTFSYSVSFAYPTASPRLTVNVRDSIVSEWSSNYGQAWLAFYCTEYKTSDSGRSVTYRWYRADVFAFGNHVVTPWDMIGTDGNNRTGLWPYECYFQLLYERESHRGIMSPRINITSIAGQTVATTWALRATQVSTSSGLLTSTSQASTATSTSDSSTRAIIPSTSTSTLGPTNWNPSEPSNNGLSTGAKAGISVGVIVGVLAIGAMAFYFHRNHRILKAMESRLAEQQGNTMAEVSAYGNEGAGYQDEYVQRYVQPYQWPQEMDVGGLPAAHEMRVR